MISINKSSFVGKGSHREVYRHPENHNLCIKVIVDGSDESRQELREKTYYKHLQKRGASFDMLPQYYGDITTDLGIGSVFDLICDHDGNVSQTLEYYLESNEMTELYYDSLEKSYLLLKDYLLKNRIITKTLAPRNIVCQRNESGIFRLYIIDNIGNLDSIPLSNYVSFLAKRKVVRRWERFECNILEANPENKALQRLVTISDTP